MADSFIFYFALTVLTVAYLVSGPLLAKLDWTYALIASLFMFIVLVELLSLIQIGPQHPGANMSAVLHILFTLPYFLLHIPYLWFWRTRKIKAT